MGDDLNIVLPEIPEEEDDTYERAGEELVILLTAQAERLGECIARLADLEIRIAELSTREYAAIEHIHEGFAEAGHAHSEFATIEHAHEQPRTPEERKPDRPPERQHPYFRKIGEF